MNDIETLVRMKYEFPTPATSNETDCKVFSDYPDAVIKSSMVRILDYLTQSASYNIHSKNSVNAAKQYILGYYSIDDVTAMLDEYDRRHAPLHPELEMICWTAYSVISEENNAYQLASMFSQVLNDSNYEYNIKNYVGMIIEELCKWELNQ